MAKKTSSTNQPKTPKQQYFVPSVGISVEAESAAEAVKVAQETVKKQKDGDAQ
jgi:hypothetical protein